MPFADPVTSVAIMHDEPFILLGCASGNVQVVSMLDSSGCTAAGAAPVHTLELQPFQGLPLPLHHKHDSNNCGFKPFTSCSAGRMECKVCLSRVARPEQPCDALTSELSHVSHVA